MLQDLKAVEHTWENEALTEPGAIADRLVENDFQPVEGHRFTLHMDSKPGFDGIVHCQVLEVEPSGSSPRPSRHRCGRRRYSVHKRVVKRCSQVPAPSGNRAGELLVSNAACEVFFEDVAPELLVPPVNARRVALHPQGMARRVLNFDQWAPHVTESLRRECARNPDPALETLLDELDGYVRKVRPGPDHLGLAVPLQLRARHGELRLITTLTSFATATDVSLSELRLGGVPSRRPGDHGGAH